MAKCGVVWYYFLNLVVVFVCHFAGVMAQEEVSCYGSGSIALSVILTLIIGALLAVAIFFLWKKFIKPKKGQHLILETDPEKGKGEYAFDNPGFKDAGLTPVGKTLDKSKVDSGNKTKWNQWSPLGVLTLKNEKKRTLDDSAIQDLHKIVTLRSHDFTGLGFNICGNMKDGIFIKDILNRGPAFESGKLNPGDRINSVTISFEHMVYEDALAILSYASPYEVIVSAKSGKAFNYPGPAGRPGHPIFRSSSTVDLSHVEKSSKKRLFQPDDSSDLGSNYSSLQKTRSNATTLERSKSKSPKPNPKLIKPKNKLSQDQLKMQLEQNIVEDYKETLRMKNDLESPQKMEAEHQKTENKHHKFGIQVLPMENREQRSPKSAELSQNDNNINLEKVETALSASSIDEVDKKVAPPVKKREKINKPPEVDTFNREDPLNGSGIKRDENNIPLEIPNNMLNAAMAARKNRKPAEEEDVKSPKKLKGKAPAPPEYLKMDDEARSKFDEIYPVEETDGKWLIISKNLNKSDDSIEKMNPEVAKDYNSDSDVETDNQSSVNTIELNASDITIHQSEENEEKQNRKTASTGDLTKIQKTRKTSSGTLERAQSLDITDTTMPALAKKRKAGKIEDNFDSKTSSDDSLYGNALINKEPRLSLILDGLNTFQRSRLKKSTEWGNMEDAILNLKPDGSSESIGKSISYEDIKLSSENLTLNFDAKSPEFDALVNKIKEIKQESIVHAEGEVRQVTNQIWPVTTSSGTLKIDEQPKNDDVNIGTDYEVRSGGDVRINSVDSYAIKINKPDEIADLKPRMEMRKPDAALKTNQVGIINKPEEENQESVNVDIIGKVEELKRGGGMKSESFEIKFDDSRDFNETQVKINNSERFEVKPETNVQNKHTFGIKFDKVDNIEPEIRHKPRIEPQIKLRTERLEKPEPPKRSSSEMNSASTIEVNEIRMNKQLHDVRISTSEVRVNKVEDLVMDPPPKLREINVNKSDYLEEDLPEIKLRTIPVLPQDRLSKTLLNETSRNSNELVSPLKVVRPSKTGLNETMEYFERKPNETSKTMLNEKSVGITVNKSNFNENVVIASSNLNEEFVLNRPEINEKVVITKPERLTEIKTSKVESSIDININKPDKLAEIKINKPERLVETKSDKLGGVVEMNTTTTTEVNSRKPEKLKGLKIDQAEDFVESSDRFVEIKTSKNESFLQINTENTTDMQAHTPEKFLEIKTNKPDDVIAKQINTERIQVGKVEPKHETSVETISIKTKEDYKPTIKHKIVKPEMSQVNSFILAEREATNKNFQPPIVKSDDTNVSDDMKVSRHSLGSLERAKTDKSDNVSNITISDAKAPSFETNVNNQLEKKVKNVAESVKNFENIIVSTPDLIKNITIAEAIHDLNNEVTIEGPSSLTFEIPGGNVEMLEGKIAEFNGHNGIKMKSNGDINKLEVSAEESNSNSLTYVTEIQVLTPNNKNKNVSEIEIIPKGEQVVIEKAINKNLDNDFESYIKNFESNIKNFETNIHSFEQNIQDVAETAKMDVSASTKSSIIINEKVDAAKELQKVQEIVEEQLKKLPEMRFTTSSYESQIKPPEKRQSQIEILRSNFEKSTSPPRLGKSEPSPPKSRIPVLNKTPPTSPERRDSKILDTEPDKEILEIMSSHIPMTSSLKYQPKTPTRNVTVTSIRSNSKIPSGLPTYNSRPPVPPRKIENDDIVQVSANGNDSSFRQWVFNPSDSAVTNITVTETKFERK